MFNNSVTYSKKWETPENLKALKKVEEKYFPKSICYPSCPVAWAPEVLEMMDKLESELGFKYNELTIKARHIEGNFFQWFFINPFIYSFNTAKYCFTYKSPKCEKRNIPLIKKFKEIAKRFIEPIGYGFKATNVKYFNPIKNKIYKGKITLSQLKEKHGYLTCYFSDIPEMYKQYVESEVRKCEIKLAIKGCYYSLETLYNSTSTFHVGTESRPDILSVKYGTSHIGEKTTIVTKTRYRKDMQDLGIDLKELQIKIDMKDASKADPQ